MLLKLIKTRPFISGSHCEVWEINHLTGNRHLGDVFVLNEHLPLELIYRVTVNCRGICIAGKPVGWQWEERLDLITENNTKNKDKNHKNILVNQKSGDSVCCEQHPSIESPDSVIISKLPLPNQSFQSNSVPSTESSPYKNEDFQSSEKNVKKLSYAERTERAVTEYLRAVQEIHEEIYIDVCQPEPDLPGYPHTDYHPDDYPVIIGLDDIEDCKLEIEDLEDEME